MAEEFSIKFHKNTIPALLTSLNDPFPRLLAHACAALTNFCEFSECEVVKPFSQSICQKLVQLIEHDSIFVKENAATCLAMVATRMK